MNTTHCLFRVVLLVFGVAWGSAVFGQANQPRAVESIAAGRVLKPNADVPAAALETVEGRQLAVQLRNLRQSESGMGPNHPSLGAVRAEIEAVKQRLGTFSPNEGKTNDENRGPTASAVDRMSDGDLRQLVTQLMVRIEQLERRIFVLERSPQAMQ